MDDYTAERLNESTPSVLPSKEKTGTGKRPVGDAGSNPAKLPHTDPAMVAPSSTDRAPTITPPPIVGTYDAGSLDYDPNFWGADANPPGYQAAKQREYRARKKAAK